MSRTFFGLMLCFLACGGRSHADLEPARTSAGGQPTRDNPSTLGDERAGIVQCWGEPSASSPQGAVTCTRPSRCCTDGTCVVEQSACSGLVQNCDGDEDCAIGEHCCRATRASECRPECSAGAIQHLACRGPCADWDRDMIPDELDACTTNQIEDGNPPDPDDGCRDGDSDGVRDGKDQCPGKNEDGLPPNPKDGCPG